MFLTPLIPRKKWKENQTPKMAILSFYSKISKSVANEGAGRTFTFTPGNRGSLDCFNPQGQEIMGRIYRVMELVQKQPLYLSNYVGSIKSNHGLAVCSVLMGGIGQITIASLLSGSPLLDKLLKEGPPLQDLLKSWIMQILFALDYLHNHDIVVGNLNLNNVYISDNGHLSLLNYAHFYLTGSDVDFPIGSLGYIAPEIFENEKSTYTKASDVWQVGVLILEIVLGRSICSHLTTIDEAREHTANLKSNIPSNDIIDEQLKSFLDSCLAIDPATRPEIPQLFNQPFLQGGLEKPSTWFKRPFIPPLDQSIHELETFYVTKPELYYLWKVAGGDLLYEIPEKSSKRPAILSIPSWVSHSANVEELALALQERPPFSSEPKIISLEEILKSNQKLRDSAQECQKVLDRYLDTWKYSAVFSSENLDELWTQYITLPPKQLNLKNKEKDLEYQFIRLFRFNSLLASYPITRESLQLEAVADIPPILRGVIWASILEVVGEPDLIYEQFNNDEPCETDRQLDLDIPRCHQYHELLSTPLGHQKLKRVLKAWVKCENGKQVYWQGMDSLAACFVTINFYNEALAFASMKNFIDKHCKGYFVSDNSKLMREHMLTLRYLVSFHDPELSHHLHSIGLGPEFYAISWFMTLFAHIFPLDKIYFLWDHLLTGPDFFFMYIALSILVQLRDQLLISDFTNAMLVFADLGDINIESCIIYALHKSKITPPSLFYHLVLAQDLVESAKSSSVQRFSFLSNKVGILPAISLEDFNTIEPHAVVVDTRPLDQFMGIGHVPGSVLILMGPVLDSKEFFSTGLLNLLERKRFSVIVTTDENSEVGMLLLKLKQARMTLVNGETFMDTDVAQLKEPLCQCKPQFFGNQWQYKCMMASKKT